MDRACLFGYVKFFNFLRSVEDLFVYGRSSVENEECESGASSVFKHDCLIAFQLFSCGERCEGEEKRP